MRLRQGGLSMRAVAEPQPIWLLIQIAPEDRAQQPAGGDIVRAVALKVKALRPGPLVGGKCLCQGLDLWSHHGEMRTPDMHLVATEHKGLRRRAPQGQSRHHTRSLLTRNNPEPARRGLTPRRR